MPQFILTLTRSVLEGICRMKRSGEKSRTDGKAALESGLWRDGLDKCIHAAQCIDSSAAMLCIFQQFPKPT